MKKHPLEMIADEFEATIAKLGRRHPCKHGLYACTKGCEYSPLFKDVADKVYTPEYYRALDASAVARHDVDESGRGL